MSSKPTDTTYVITAPRKFSLNLKELWQYRELFFYFTWRDVKVRYKQTILGFLWAVLQPLITMVIFVLFFSRALGLSTDDIPPPIFYYSGLLVWNIFSSGVNNAGNSIINNADIIKKIYFPRLIIPASSILVAFFDFIMSFIIFLIMLLYYYLHGFEFEVSIWAFHMLLGLPLTLISVAGFSTLIASLNVKYRDFRYVIPFLIQSLFFLTPVIYPSSILNNGGLLGKLLYLNPMTGAVVLTRSAFNTGLVVDWNNILISLGAAIVLLLLGIYNFGKMEAYFADIA